MAGLVQTVAKESAKFPVKNTFIHLPTEGDADPAGCKRRCRSEPPRGGRSLRGAAPGDLTTRGTADKHDECESDCDGVRRTLSGDSSTYFNGSEHHGGRWSDMSDTDSSDGDSTRENLVAKHADATGVTSIAWTVEAERLEGTEHKVSSPVFLLAVPGWGLASFQILLYAHNKRQVLTFEQALGQGRVELKCLDSLPAKFGNIAYNIKVGEQMRGWVVHDFSRVMQHSERRVDFAAMADTSNRTLSVEVAFAPVAVA